MEYEIIIKPFYETSPLVVYLKKDWNIYDLAKSIKKEFVLKDNDKTTFTCITSFIIKNTITEDKLYLKFADFIFDIEKPFVCESEERLFIIKQENNKIILIDRETFLGE